MLGAESDSARSALQQALFLAEEYGLPVFPCRSHAERVGDKILQIKSPLTIHGFKDASLNTEQIVAWWTQYPDALIGVPTGEPSLLFAIDVDPQGAQWYLEHSNQLAAGRVHQTQRGHHLLYRACGLPNSTGTLAPGVDTRGEGGYIIWWPAHGLPATGELEALTDLPNWVRSALNGAGSSQEPPAGDRSRDLLAQVAARIRAGKSDAEILTELVTHPHAAAQADPRRAVQRAIGEALKDPRTAQPRARASGSQDEPAAPSMRSPLDLVALEGQMPPERIWALEHWLPQSHPVLLAGRGGIGKTLLAQHLATALCLARGYVDDIRRPLRVLLWAGEDDQTELWRRQLPICRYFGVQLADLQGKLMLQSYEGEDISLASMIYGTLTPTPLLQELTAQVHDYQADYVFLDNIARIYGGNENDRHSVTNFVAWVSKACRPAGVCILGHPARSAGSEYSGSSAWEGSVRSRLYLSDRLPDAPPPEEDEPAVEGQRFLSRRKSNYSANDWRALNYVEGVLIPENVHPEPIGHLGDEFIADIVRRAVVRLISMGLPCNSSTRSPEYLPALARKYELLEQIAEKRFAAAMRRMIKEGKLLIREVGKYSNRTPKMGLIPA